MLIGALLALAFDTLESPWRLHASQYVHLPENIFSEIALPDLGTLFSDSHIWRTAIIICFIATLETLLSIEAIDKIDPYNRITPQNRELIAQGAGNFVAGLVGGIPITSVIVRSAANAEAGAKTKVSAMLHGFLLLLTILFATRVVASIPYCVLAVILIRTGYNLAKPGMIFSIYRQGREQFLPFIVTVVAILGTDLLIGVLIGITYAIYFLIKHTYRAGYVLRQWSEGHIRHFKIELALNVSFLNKRRFRELLDTLPEYATVEIDGSNSVYIDSDILEIFQQFKVKARNKHIALTTKGIPDVEIVEVH
ncbi:MAG: SulP family inorganic anion transporter [Bacteroidia bacterium]|nr:SulP family inorganic anion transporter [Bacteroidia bacterium]